MNPLKPLLYLSYKSIWNGLRRALTSPKRLIYILFFVGYYFMLFIRPALTPSGRHVFMGAPGFSGRFPFPPLEVLDALAFGVFAILSLFMMYSTSLYQAALRPADVDVLFPTPISPKVVFFFKLGRDYLITLIAPFLFAILGLQASKMGWEALFRNMPHPEYASMTLRTAALSWVLMALSFVAITHAVSLAINRSDEQSDRNKRIYTWGVGILFVGLGGFVWYWVTSNPGAEGLLRLAQLPVLRVLFFQATFATYMTMAPLKGSLVWGLFGAAGLLAAVAVSVVAALRQIEWFYDQAAIKGYSSAKQRQLQRSGDFGAIVAERARAGKVRTRTFGWVNRLKMKGPAALLWKEMYLQPRTILGVILTLIGLDIGMCLLAVYTVNSGGGLMGGYTLLIMQGFVALMFSTIIGQTGFVEVLRRVDLEKALPFAPNVIVFYEVLGRAVLPTLAAWIGSVVFVIGCPHLWSFAVSSVIVMPGVATLLVSSIFLVTIVFPDLDDPSQRQFRGLMMLFGFGVAGFFPTALFILLAINHLALPLCAIASTAACFGLAAVLCALSGVFYANFNPSE